MTDVTEILRRIDSGDLHAANSLLPIVYDQLRRLAAQKLAQERPGQTLEATALVHEAYVRLVGAGPEQPWNSRGHFYAAAAEAMRRILVENARRKQRIRHGGDKKRVDLENVHAIADARNDELLALDEALAALAREDTAAAEVVKLRYFSGLTIQETADALAISVRTANRHWAYAKAWLYQRLSETANGSH
jgi:RNA polymerase sigma factor (TIGR02999 family)